MVVVETEGEVSDNDTDVLYRGLLLDRSMTFALTPDWLSDSVFSMAVSVFLLDIETESLTHAVLVFPSSGPA